MLEVNYPDVKNYGDITKIDYASLPDFDLFTGGFPCQPFSNAGLQMGEDDKYGRGTLLYGILRLVKCKRPKYILLENVKGFTAKKFQTTFDYLKNTLKRLGYGDLSYAVLNTKDYGIPQNRERLWMFAQLGGGGVDMVPPRIDNGLRLKDFLDKDPDSSLYLSDERVRHYKEAKGIESFVVDEPLCFDAYNRKIRKDGICMALTDGKHNITFIVEPPKEDGKERLRRLPIDEQFRLMGLNDGELDYAGLSKSQLSKRAGNGWDVHLVGILLRHIFEQLHYFDK